MDGSLYHVGVVVADVDAGMDHYARLLGLGPFARLDTDYAARWRGEVVRVANHNAFARWGDIWLEIVAPGDHPAGPAADWLRTRGEGIFHVGYATSDLRQRPGGAAVAMELVELRTAEDDPAIVYLDTVASLGYYVELVDQPVVDGLMRWIDENAR